MESFFIGFLTGFSTMLAATASDLLGLGSLAVDALEPFFPAAIFSSRRLSKAGSAWMIFSTRSLSSEACSTYGFFSSSLRLLHISPAPQRCVWGKPSPRFGRELSTLDKKATYFQTRAHGWWHICMH